MCGHDLEENCNQDCVNDLIVFEIQRKLFEELKMGEKKHEEYENMLLYEIENLKNYKSQKSIELENLIIEKNNLREAFKKEN